MHFVGEISCPPIKEGDLIVLGSGSGTTQSLIVMGEKAKKVGARIATVTMFPTHTIGQMADVIVTVPGSTPKKAEGEKNLAESNQPMGNLFEQMSWLTYVRKQEISRWFFCTSSMRKCWMTQKWMRFRRNRNAGSCIDKD